MKTICGAGVCLLAFLASSPLFGAPVPVDHMVVFGDSLSDIGNLYTVTHFPAPPAYAAGRTTDGPDTYPASAISGMWEEQLAPSLGLPSPQPDLINTANLNFAFSGAESGALANSASGPYGMAAQVQRYLAENPTNTPTGLYFFWGGTNDLLDYPDPVTAAQSSVANISNQIASVIAAGGKYFVWLNLPPLDLTPRGGGSVALQTASAAFATQMQQAIASLRISYPGVTIIPVDIYSLYKQAIQSPAQYGLTNVTTASQGTPVNPDGYIFWDALHPTTKMHQLIAQLIEADVAPVLGIIPGQIKAAVSDDFNLTGLNASLWTVAAPPDATVALTNGHLSLSLPAGANHDAFVGGNLSAHVLQPVSNVDFDVAAKFDSVPNAAYAGEGILVQQNDGTYLRFEVFSDGTQLYLTGASASGGAETDYFSTPLSSVSSPLWLEVKRTGDTWVLSSSSDGVNYLAGGSFTQNINVTAIGPYAWNYNIDVSAAPAFSSLVDSFYNLSAQ